MLRAPWIPLLPLGAAALLAALLRIGEPDDVQRRNLTTLIAFAAAFLLAALWAIFLSPWPRRVRGTIAAALVVLALLIRIEGTSGDLVPSLRLRGWRRPPPKEISAPPASDLSRARDFPRFLGPSGDGRLPDARLGSDWTSTPPRERWRRALGEGWSGFAVAGGRAVTMEQHGEEERVVAYDLGSGRPLWSRGTRARYATTLGGVGPRATPTIHDGRVYALGATGKLRALSLADGAPAWEVDLALPVPDWGFAASPVVEGDLLLVHAGPTLAFDRSSGRVKWRGEAEDGASYATPIVATLNGRRQVVAVGQASCSGFDLEDGARLWRHAWRGDQPKCASPLAFDGGRVLISAGYGVGSDFFQVEGGATRIVWTSKRLKSKFASVVEKDGHVYGLDDGRLVCVRLSDGERAWAGERYGHGQILLAGERLLVTSESGDVALVDASPAAYVQRARAKALDGKLWNPPALAGAYLLLRTDSEAVCLELP
jgi:outer membrane protein assembly factor BamB